MTTTHTAGDTFTRLRSWPAYPAGAGWVGKLRLVPRSTAGGAAVIELTAGADGDTHLFTATAAATAAWVAGAYALAEWVELDGQVVTIGTDELLVAPDPRSLTAGTDGRSLAVRTLADLIAARASFVASQGMVASYKVGDRERTFRTAAELNQEIAYWQGQVDSETQAARLAQGLRPRNQIFVRFTRPR
jgi:hypothetical protein